MTQEEWKEVWVERMNSGNRAATGTLISGIVIAAIGAILLLDRFGIFSADILWRLWPLGFVIAGGVRLYETGGSRAKAWGAFLISLGALLTLHEFGFFRFGLDQLWPLFLIAAGAILAWHSHEVRQGNAGFRFPRVGNPTGSLSPVAFFGAVERRPEGIIADRGEIVAIFGGFKIDLSRAEIAGDSAVIDATAIFGGGEIIVPEWWRVSVEGVGVFGGYVDKTRHIPRPDKALKTLVVRGAAVFGGIEVKSY